MCHNNLRFHDKLDELLLETRLPTEASLHEYAQRLAAASQTMPRRVEAFRSCRPQQFIRLCTFHLSLLIDLPFHATLDQCSTNLATDCRHAYATRSVSRHHILCDNVIRLMNYLMSNGVVGNGGGDDPLRTEGIFRKSGNIIRQRELCNRVLVASEEMQFPLEVNDAGGDGGSVGQKYGVHEYAGALKMLLGELQQSELLLTTELLPLFDAVAKQLGGDGVEVGESGELMQAKLMNSVRLLRLLMAADNQRVLQNLLCLMTCTLGFSSFNRMTAESLGTLFGPILLAPKHVSSVEFQRNCAAWSRLTTRMIEAGVAGVFVVPVTLIHDIDRNLDLEESPPPPSPTGTAVGGNDVENTSAIATGFQFVDCSTNTTSAEETTKCAVAELCSTVYRLPDNDPRKSVLLRKINRSNGGLSPYFLRQRQRTNNTPSSTPWTIKVKSRHEPPSTSSGRETFREEDKLLNDVIQKLSAFSLAPTAPPAANVAVEVPHHNLCSSRSGYFPVHFRPLSQLTVDSVGLT